MAAKTEAPAPEAAPAAAKAGGGGGGVPIVPLIAVLVLAPALSWAVAQFVLVPQLKAALAHGPAEAGAEAPAEHAEAESGHGGGHGGKKGAEGASDGNLYEFTNVVVNLAGTMGTRYLKVTFTISGSDPGLRATFETRKMQLTDVTLNVLSSLTLADLEEAGAKNLIREKLVAAYNQAIGKKMADQVYFSDFVVQ